jgi:hypothetical protein
VAAHTPYSIPDRRALTGEEQSLLRFLLERQAPHRLGELETLKIVARCGCGKCPTVLFGYTPDAEPLTGSPFTELASYRGKNKDGVTVGVVLIEREGKLAELEAWSPHGPDIKSWPSVATLEAERAS